MSSSSLRDLAAVEDAEEDKGPVDDTVGTKIDTGGDDGDAGGNDDDEGIGDGGAGGRKAELGVAGASFCASASLASRSCLRAS